MSYFVEFYLKDEYSWQDLIEELNKIKIVDGYQAVGDVAVLYDKYYKKVEKKNG